MLMNDTQDLLPLDAVKPIAIAIVGATGLVGNTLLTILESRNFPCAAIYFLASQQSTNKTLTFKGQTHPIHDLATFDFTRTKIAFFCVSHALTAQYAEKAVALGNVVIDKSSCYRNHPAVPLIVPEVNLNALSQYTAMGIIANPNCNTIPVAVGLKPIYDAVGITRINIATYQSVSGTGKDAISELTQQTNQLLNAEPITPNVYPLQIAFNVIPHIDEFEDNGYTREEMKIVLEMKKILQDDNLAINPTTVRVPVYCGHAAAVHIETRDKLSAQDAIALLAKAEGVAVMTGRNVYPTPACHAAGKDAVFIGRIREDISHPKGLNLWIVADNLRKGAALNAVQIAEYMLTKRLLKAY